MAVILPNRLTCSKYPKGTAPPRDLCSLASQLHVLCRTILQHSYPKQPFLPFPRPPEASAPLASPGTWPLNRSVAGHQMGKKARKSGPIPSFVVVVLLLILLLRSVHTMEPSGWWSSGRHLHSVYSTSRTSPFHSPKGNGSPVDEFEDNKHEVPSGANPDSNR
ncbi:hypothetical protein HPP92_008963 [Vanilla planifolia]|uniref:Uncharacterized protein n=1 Tax=Vanilla planifolia TaxID=51239 RepID=A0A835V2E8_VANPL|nr:hypothetical protein HPP92_008963 [Vanilla planifolia]